jgi:hypothetical protein
VFLTWTSERIFDAIAGFARSRPPIVAHWDLDRDPIRFQSLEFGLTEDQARDCLTARLARMLPDGWT